MSSYTIDQSARQDPRRLMNGALLRVAVTAAASVLFALVHCVDAADGGPIFASPAIHEAPPALAQAAAAPSADSLDHAIGTGTQVRRN